jgi:hypothetical protein
VLHNGAFPLPGVVRYDSTRLLPPHLMHANTSSAKLLLSNPAQSSRGVRFFFISCLAAASGAALAACSPPWGNSELAFRLFDGAAARFAVG